MTTLHILSNPYSPVSLSNRVDPFSPLAYKFIKYMQTVYNWDCIHYSTVGADVPCEMVQCNDKITGNNARDVATYNINASRVIGQRKKPGDMIACFHGWENKGATEEHTDLKIIEPSIGYDAGAVFAPYRVFASYAHMHMFYGGKGMLMTPSWFDAVIPNAITPEEFEFSEEKDDYFLHFGRVIETKGLHVAIQATEYTGTKLIVAGSGSLKHLGYMTTPKHVTEVGVCDPEQRKKLMSRARAIIGATYYVEPFGNMIAEGYMSGTPAITTDWGGFTETVVQGVTGFRCREFREFVNAIEQIETIKPQDCLNYAMTNYSDDVVHAKFDRYFDKIRSGDFYRK